MVFLLRERKYFTLVLRDFLLLVLGQSPSKNLIYHLVVRKPAAPVPMAVGHFILCLLFEHTAVSKTLNIKGVQVIIRYNAPFLTFHNVKKLKLYILSWNNVIYNNVEI